MNPRVINVRVFGEYKLIVTFENQEVKLFDVKPYLSKGVFVELQNEALFRRAKAQFGTVIWNDYLDFDPDTLYLESSPFN